METAKNKNKNQHNKESKSLFIIFSVIAIISLVTMVIVLCTIDKNTEKSAFVPPDFDIGAIVGTPTPPENSGYRVLYQEGMSFEVGVCGKVRVKNLSAYIYLTNILKNSLWLKVRIYDEKGIIIGESGLIRPGEYLESVQLHREIDENTKIQLKIMSYEPETYYSCGAIVLNPILIVEI